MKNLKANAIANVKGFKMQVNVQIDSCTINNDRHFCGNKDYDASKRVIKGFNFGIGMEADSGEINFNTLQEEIKESLKTSINNAVKEVK